MSYQVVILVGGLGTRLRGVVNEVPKPMAQIGDKPFLEYLVLLLRENGFKKFLLLTGYKSEIIENYFLNGEKFEINIEYVKEKQPLGTAGALFNAWHKLDDEFILINGDTFFDIQYSIFNEFIKIRDPESLVVLRYSNDFSRYGVVEIDKEHRIVKFNEKGSLPYDWVDGYINGGIYFFRKRALFKFYEKYKGQNLSLEKNILPVLGSNKQILGIPMGGKFIDIGIPRDYNVAQSIILKIVKEVRKPVLFIDRDGTIIEDKGYVWGKNLTFKAKSIELMKKAKEKGMLVIIVTNQAGVAKGIFTEEDSISTTEYVIDYLKRFNILVDAYYYCPYHHEGLIEKYKKHSLLRKPEPGMILKACEDFRIDLMNSVMVGDNENTDRINLFGLSSKIIGDFQ